MIIKKKHKINSDIRFKIAMLKYRLSHAYILVKETMIITGNAGTKPDPAAPRNAAQLLATI